MSVIEDIGHPETPTEEVSNPQTPKDNSEERTKSPTPAKRPHAPTSTSSHKKKRQTATTDERLDKAFEILTSTATNSMPLDDSYHFGNLVASKLRLYNDDIRCAIQSDILKIFLRAGRGFYNSVADSPHTSHTNTPLSKSQYLNESDHSQHSQYSEQYQSHDDYSETSRSRPSTPSSQRAHQLPNHSQYQHPAKLLKQSAYPNQSDYSQQSQSLEQFPPHNDYHSEYHRTSTLLS